MELVSLIGISKGRHRPLPPSTRFFLRLNFVSDWILSWTGFCLGMDFVWDYISQLYFVCNHLIWLLRSLAMLCVNVSAEIIYISKS